MLDASAGARKPFTICFLGAVDLQPAGQRARRARSRRCRGRAGAPIGRSPSTPQQPRGTARCHSRPLLGRHAGRRGAADLARRRPQRRRQCGRARCRSARASGARRRLHHRSRRRRVHARSAASDDRPAVRTDRLRAALADLSVAVILLDMVHRLWRPRRSGRQPSPRRCARRAAAAARHRLGHRHRGRSASALAPGCRLERPACWSRPPMPAPPSWP